MARNIRARRGLVLALASFVPLVALGSIGPAGPAHAAGTPRVSVGDAQVMEGNTPASRTATFALVLNQPAAADVVVNWMLLPGTASAGSDFNDYGGTMRKTTPIPDAMGIQLTYVYEP